MIKPMLPISRTFKSVYISTRGSDHSALTSVQLMHMQNIFLLERIQHPKRDEQRLLETARSSLAMVVLIWSERYASNLSSAFFS